MTEKCRTPVEIEVEGIGELKTNNSDLLKGFQRQNEIYSFCMQKVISGLEASSQDLAWILERCANGTSDNIKKLLHFYTRLTQGYEKKLEE